MLYRLSRFVPVPMTSTYGLLEADGTATHYRTRWVQWRGRSYRNRSRRV